MKFHTRFERPEISVDRYNRYNRYNRYDCVTVPCGARRFAGLRDTPSPDRPSDRRHRHRRPSHHQPRDDDRYIHVT